MSEAWNYSSESQDTSKISSMIPSGETEPDSLPRGSGLGLKTIEMLSRQIGEAETLDQAKEFAASIQREVSELIKRLEKRQALQALQSLAA